MGVAIKEILEFEEIDLSKLANKKIAIDSFNMLYQFLASIRQADGNPLTDFKGNVTSHLKGLFNRCVYFKKNNVKAVFVFDGKAPKLKEKEKQNREAKKQEADKKLREALDIGDFETAKKYQGTGKLTQDMVDDAKKLISLFGFPVIVAPSEGEAQASYLVDKGVVWACSSQDFDSLLFGSRYLIRNLSVSNKRKIPGSSVYKEVPIEFFDLEKNLQKLGIDRDELIVIGILCGTDFNPGGIKGVGPKKALKFVKEYRDRWDELFNLLDWWDYFSYPWNEVFNTFKKIPVEDVSDLKFESMNRDAILEFLEIKSFDAKLLERSLNTVKSVKTLDSYFG
ncbi:MAG: flap endonuclease-1 [Nanoarchaeota archaeon]